MTLRSSGNLGMGEKKKIRARRSEAEEADSSVVLSHFRVFFWSKRGRLRAHALRRGGLSASVPTLTRRLLGLTFIYYPTPRAAPPRGLPWTIVLSPRSAGLLNSAHLRFASQLYKLAVFLIIPTRFFHHLLHQHPNTGAYLIGIQATRPPFLLRTSYSSSHGIQGKQMKTIA